MAQPLIDEVRLIRRAGIDIVWARTVTSLRMLSTGIAAASQLIAGSLRDKKLCRGLIGRMIRPVFFFRSFPENSGRSHHALIGCLQWLERTCGVVA